MENKERQRLLELEFKERGCMESVEEYASLRVSEAVETATDKFNIDIANQDAEIIYLNEQLTSKDKEIGHYQQVCQKREELTASISAQKTTISGELFQANKRISEQDKEIAELKVVNAQLRHLAIQNSAQLEQAKKENPDLRKIFDSGKLWGETYSTWFIPTEEDHDRKFNEAVSGVVSVSTEKEEGK